MVVKKKLLIKIGNGMLGYTSSVICPLKSFQNNEIVCNYLVIKHKILSFVMESQEFRFN